jgi:tetratricopeptide (TPR) repeat protein
LDKTIEKISPTKINPEWKSNPAKYYSEVFDARFKANKVLGNNELQEMITNAKPSIGYLFLAQIIAKTNNKFVLTTNFDTMTEDALFLIKNVKPFVIGHNSLAHLLTTSNPSRPIIAKLHNDFLLDPKSSSKELISLPQGFQDIFNNILKENKTKKPIYWCCRDEKRLSNYAKELLTENDFIVEIKGFDEFMLNLAKELKLDSLIDKDNIDNSKLVKNAKEEAKGFQEQLIDFVGKNREDKDLIKSMKDMLPNWWSYQIKAKKEKDSEKAESIYRDGIKEFPKSSELAENYANFLKNIRNEYDEAEKYYKKALDIEPNDANNNGNYALFLHDIRNEYDEA